MKRYWPSRVWRGNPLRRRSDVVEAWAALLLGVLALLVAPALGAVSGCAAHADARDHARTQLAARHQVRARLLDDAPEFTPSADGVQHIPTYPVTVRWTDREGRTITALAPVEAGLEHGDAVTVWLDARGDVTTAPWNGDDIWSRTVARALLVTTTVAGLAVAVRLVLHRILDRLRLAGWEREWRRVGPDWGRRPT
ncbi:Rv1733c family protein [Streptomyces sp. cg35]|uniref:Rv1733c family protein n=1 Tax=Streptomyces sp. cg35 TaxID=3421650 RepID=UPI003D16CE38